MKFTDNAMSVHLLRRDNGGFQTPATPADIIAALKANPEACEEVSDALLIQWRASAAEYRIQRDKATDRATAAEAELAALSALIHTESGLDDHRYSPEQMVTEMALLWQGASDDCEAAERVVEAAVRWRTARAACLGIRDAADALASATWVWEAHKTSAGEDPNGREPKPVPEPAGTWLQMHGCTVDVDEDAGDYWHLFNAIAATCARRGVSVFLDNARVQVRRGPSADGVAFLPNFCNFRQE